MIAIETAPETRATPLPERPANNRDAKGRLTFLDWSRGLAVVIMLQGHVFHSFIRNDLRNDGSYVISQFFGGIGPAIFLVLTGITLAFIMDRSQKRELPLMSRWYVALRRAGYLFMLAILFRLQLWTFAFGQSPWTDLLKVDVLNLMGFSIGLMSIMAVFATADRARLCAVLGALIAAASPVISSLDWHWLPPEVSNYLVPSYAFFGFFPWAAFIAFGMSIGSILRLTKPDQMNRVMQWGAIAGFALILGGQYFSTFPYSIYPKSEFWLNSPMMVITKLGTVMLIMAAAYVWTEFGVKNSWSWVRQLGTTSLLVYWVHIELVYGRWFGPWKENLSTPQVVAAAISLIVLMVLLSVVRSKWRNVKLPALFTPPQSYSPRRVSGD